jgi:hypothetical protein
VGPPVAVRKRLVAVPSFRGVVRVPKPRGAMPNGLERANLRMTVSPPADLQTVDLLLRPRSFQKAPSLRAAERTRSTTANLRVRTNPTAARGTPTETVMHSLAPATPNPLGPPRMPNRHLR